MPWTDERVAKLKRLWPTGLSASKIAAEFGDISRNSVIGKASRLGLGARRLSFAYRVPDPKKPRRPRDHTIRQRMRPAAKTPMPTWTTDFDIPLHQRRALLDLEPHHCRFPVGEPGAADFFFCGGDIAPGFLYCPAHCARAYTYRPAREKSEAQAIHAARQRSTRRAAEAAIRTTHQQAAE